MTNSYISNLETVVEEVSDWAVDLVDHVIDALSPNGRPFAMELLSDEEKLGRYMQIRGNFDAWQAFISKRAEEIAFQLADAGVSQEDIAAIKPLDLAIAYCIDYSADMEKLVTERYGDIL